MRLKNIYLYCLLVSLGQAGYAQDLGQYGTTYPIIEIDMRAYIQNRLQQLQVSGELVSYQNNFMKHVKAHILRPTPVMGLTHTVSDRVFYYDPTFILKHAILDVSGQVLIPSGQIINPLKVIPYHRILLFFDGDDKRQIQWIKQKCIQYQNSTDIKPIAVSGNIERMSRLLSAHVYFDQNGFLVHKLGILHVPCQVTPSQLKLKIHEIRLSQEHGVSDV